MRILYITRDLESTGTSLPLALARSAQSRCHYAQILVTGDEFRPRIVGGVPIHAASTTGGLAQTFNRRPGFDVVHAVLTDATFNAVEWLAGKQTPLVLTLFDAGLQTAQPRLNALLRSAHCVVVGSTRLGETLRRHHQGAIIRVVPHGIDFRGGEVEPAPPDDTPVPWRIEEEAFVYSQIYREAVSRP